MVVLGSHARFARSLFYTNNSTMQKSTMQKWFLILYQDSPIRFLQVRAFREILSVGDGPVPCPQIRSSADKVRIFIRNRDCVEAFGRPVNNAFPIPRLKLIRLDCIASPRIFSPCRRRLREAVSLLYAHKIRTYRPLKHLKTIRTM